LHDAGLATVAYFYLDFRDASKRDARGLLSSLLIQFCAQSDPFCEILSDLYSKHNRGSQQPSGDALLQCLKKMLELPGQGPLYIIIDALDECPSSSGFPTQRERALKIVQELVEVPLPCLHLCITSRPEIDIRAVLEPLAVHNISLHNESGQNQDIIDYIHSVVRSDPKMRKWREEDKILVIDTLTLKAGGM
jgi:NACHT domain